MDDREVIALLRSRLSTVEGGVREFLDVLGRTGEERQAAWGEMKRGWNEIVEGWTPTIVEDFLKAYERTMPERDAAAGRLIAALTTDFRTALLSSPDVTEEQLREWGDGGDLGVSAAPTAPSGRRLAAFVPPVADAESPAA